MYSERRRDSVESDQLSPELSERDDPALLSSESSKSFTSFFKKPRKTHSSYSSSSSVSSSSSTVSIASHLRRTGIHSIADLESTSAVYSPQTFPNYQNYELKTTGDPSRLLNT